MPDTLGNITVPEPAVSGTFPIPSDYPWGRIHAPEIVEHLIGNATGANLKVTQRFYLGNGAKRFLLRCTMNETRRNLLRSFWENRSGPWEGFTYAAPNEDGTTTNYTVRFENAPLTWEFASSALSTTGLTLIEIPSSDPTYTLNATQTRFPSGGLPAALLAQVQELIPLVKITPTDPGYPAIYVSDRRCTVGGQLYLARLLSFDGIQQGLGGESDDASFTFGNADRVMTQLANDVDLFRASIEFSLFHVGSGIKLDLWKGDVADWAFDAGVEFSMRAVDGLYELNLPYPTRRISRTCWKDFNDGNACPAAANGGAHLDVACDKGFDSEFGCQYHNMVAYFGGIVARPQAVRTKDNNTGTWGWGRSPLVSSSLVADSIYDEVVPEVYTDEPLPINGKIVAGRDEGDFYTALAVLCEGPIGGMDPGLDSHDQPRYHLLDGQQHHGPGNLGLRRGYGEDPARTFDPDPDSDKFSLGQGGNGIQTYGPERAAGTAFIEIRRADAKGLQLSKLSEHQIQSYISSGLSGWVWTAPGTRTFVAGLTNLVWIVVNAMLRARGLKFADAATAETKFDVAAAIAAADICSTFVAPLVDRLTRVWVPEDPESPEPPEGGHWTETPITLEKQFKFIGILQEEKPLRDWITEILMNGLCYFTFVFGKLKIGIRINSSAVEAFTEANIVHGSLKLAPIKPAYNHVTASFADGEFDFVSNSVVVYDIDYAKRIGGATSPLFLKSTLPLSGTPSKSQAARIAATRLREELGGIYRPDKDNPYLEFLAAREISFKTTVLALNVEPGMVCSLTHEDMPTYQEANDTVGAPQPETEHYGEFRVTGWRLNSDYSIDITGRTTHNDMYDMLVGPKPADVVADPIPAEQEFAPADFNFTALTRGDGILRLRDFTCATNSASVHQGYFEIYYVPEERNSYARMVGDVSDGIVTTLNYEGEPPVAGQWLLLESEIMYVVDVTPATSNDGVCTVERGQLGTAAVAHHRVSTTVSAKVNNADITVGSGLALKPGNRLFTDPGAEQRTIAEYVSATGVLRLNLPFDEIGPGTDEDVYSDPRLFRVELRNEKLDFQPRFFKSPNRADFEHQVNMPFAGVVAIRLILENTRGIQSDPLTQRFTASFPNRIRTLGTTEFDFKHPVLPAGESTDLFESLQAVQGQSFEGAYAEIISAGAEGDPVSTPRGVSAISPAALAPGGTITIGGTIDGGGAIRVKVGNKATDKIYLEVPVFWITDETTAVEVAAALSDWLNAWEEFAAFFFATSLDSEGYPSAVISITDLVGLGGELAAEVGGDVTATTHGSAPVSGIDMEDLGPVISDSAVSDLLVTVTVQGMTSQLGILTGRRYAVSYLGGDFQSELSPLSVSTGPTGGSTRVEIKDCPTPTDARVTEVQIYAAPDGLDWPLYLVARAENGLAVDAIPEGDLASQPIWAGALGLEQAGGITTTVRADGEPWFEVRIPIDQARSNVIGGLALGNVAPGAILTADVSNEAGARELKVAIY